MILFSDRVKTSNWFILAWASSCHQTDHLRKWPVGNAF